MKQTLKCVSPPVELQDRTECADLDKKKRTTQLRPITFDDEEYQIIRKKLSEN